MCQSETHIVYWNKGFLCFSGWYIWMTKTMIANMNYRYMLLVEKRKLRKSSIQPNLRDVNCKALQRACVVEYALYNNLLYGYKSTRALIGCFSCNDRALFSCNDRTLQARCPRHIQSVINLIVETLIDIHVVISWQLSKRVSADQPHLTVSWAQVYNSLRWRVF